jgi:hypothetical protein
MKILLLVSTIAGCLISATPLFAQTAFGPSYPYPQGYEELGPTAHREFGSFDYGYYQETLRARNHVPPPARKPIDEIR